MHKKFSLIIMMLLFSGIFTIGVTGQEERPQIVASHSILADVVMNVVGDAADVASTLPIGADPHAFEPIPSDLTALADADVVFVNGAFFEEGLMEAIENAGTDMNIVTVSSCVEMIAFGGHDHDEEHSEDEHMDDDDHEHEEGDDHDDEEHSEEEHSEDNDHDHDEEHSEDDEHSDGDMSAMGEVCEGHEAEIEALHEAAGRHSEGEEGDDHEHEDEDHAHEHEHGETLGRLHAAECGADGHGHDHEGEEHSEDEEHSEEGDDHDHEDGACDPHVWMEPHNVMYWTMLIRDTLIELDPANGELYTANATSYLQELDALAHEFIVPMVDTVPEANRVLISNHDSLGYFAARYDFEIVTTILPTTVADPSAEDVAEVIDLIREEGVSAIFAETTVSDSIIQTIASETDAEVFVLYSGSLSDSDGPASSYLDYMRYNVTTIVEALGGGM